MQPVCSRILGTRADVIPVMDETYLEVTFRRGRPIAAYYYLPRNRGQKLHRTRRIEPGLVIDLSRDGRPIGIEITAPSKVSVAAVNRVLTKLGLSRATRAELAPACGAQRLRQADSSNRTDR